MPNEITIGKPGELTRIRGEVHFEDMTSRNVLEKQYVQPLTMLSTTPSVLNKRIFQAINIGPVTVTDFTFGAQGQRIYILGDGFTTIQNGVLIFTNTGANKLLAVNKVYKFTFFAIPGPPISHKWVEDE